LVNEQAGPTHAIAAFVADTPFEDIPAPALDGVKLSILDTLGCALAALGQPVARDLLAYTRELGGKPVATVLGSGGYRTSAPAAAFANACLSNILDLDGFLHAPTYTLPAVLAAGELAGASGLQVLVAYVLAVEVAHRLQEVIEARRAEQAGPTYRGWYHVSLYGPLAAALATGRVLGLDAEALEGAMGAAACGAGGVRENLGARAKSLSSGVAAEVGVRAAMLARRGVTGAPGILEARFGLINAVCLPGEADWTPISERLGNPYRLAADALSTKRFPAIGATQSLLGGLAHLCASPGFRPEDITGVDARVSTFAASDRSPKDELEAGFSWPYLIAATLLDGSFRVEHLDTARIAEPRMQEMMARVNITAPAAGEREHVLVRLRNGDALEARSEPRLGRVGRDAIASKYQTLAAQRLRADRLDRLYELATNLENQPDLNELMTLLAAEP
jgi:2-methylcitrate dehydratase PrpD